MMMDQRRAGGEEMAIRSIKGKRPAVYQTHSDPAPNRVPDLTTGLWKDSSSTESRDTVLEPLSHGSMLLNTHLCPHSFSSTRYHSPASSRPSSLFGNSRPSRPSLASSITSATISVDVVPELKDSEPSTRRPSLLTRLRSSANVQEATKPTIHPSEFQDLPEEPEKHFMDSIGMVFPGACDRHQCEHPRAHFVSHWRLYEPIEYTTALADHGITYMDYSRLLQAIRSCIEELPDEPRKSSRVTPWWQLQSRSAKESEKQYILAKEQAKDLDQLLEEITWNWQRRGLPVKVCVSSYSLFAQISEAHVQILHVSLESPQPPEVVSIPGAAVRLSFIDPFLFAKSEECSVARARPALKRRSVSPHSAPHLRHNQQLQLRDRTRPWPLWPNAIPSRKREQMKENADRYGKDPYFRAWMRADINSRTKCSTYAKWMIEQENNPFINKRLEYFVPLSTESLKRGVCGLARKEVSPGWINRNNYEHNRRLEVRKAIENGGSRLRLLRFGFRQPIHPVHTPEMAELGLTQEKYNTIIGNIENIRQNCKPTYECVPIFLTSWFMIRRRSTVNTLNKVSEYIRQLNAASRRVVWTIEKIPCVNDQRMRCDKQEWEISAWNGEDPLELLIELERWGIIENKLNIEDDDEMFVTHSG